MDKLDKYEVEHLQVRIDEAFERRAEITPTTVLGKDFKIMELVRCIILHLDSGTLRVAEKIKTTTSSDLPGACESFREEWVTHQWIKKAVLLSFRIRDNCTMLAGDLAFFDKVDLKFHKNQRGDYFKNVGARIVPPAVVRNGSFIGKNVILMPSYVNIGAYVDEGTMVDTWATVGSCAQIGKNCHISGGAGIGGVLEPLQANPTIIEDNCFIGARSEIVEGVIVREGAVLSMGVFIGKNTPIVDRTKDGIITRGEVPSRAVVMMGVHPKNGLICPQIVKYRDEQTDAATSINELLRGD